MRGARVPLEYLHFHVMILLFTAANAGPSVKSQEMRNSHSLYTHITFFKNVVRKKMEAFERHLPLQQVSYIKRAWIRSIYRHSKVVFHSKACFSSFKEEKHSPVDRENCLGDDDLDD